MRSAPRWMRPSIVATSRSASPSRAAIANIAARELTRVPSIAIVAPALLEFEHEPGRRRIAAPARHGARSRMAALAQRDDIRDPARLQPPQRQREFAEDVVGEQPVGHLAGLEKLDEPRRDRIGLVLRHDTPTTSAA
jgi:hypothetical protein